MQYILVHVGSISKYPPAMNVIQHLDDQGIDLVLCTTKLDDSTKKEFENRNIIIEDIGFDYEKKYLYF